MDAYGAHGKAADKTQKKTIKGWYQWFYIFSPLATSF